MDLAQLNLGTRQKLLVSHVQEDNIFFVQLDTEEAYALPDLSKNIQKEVEAKPDQITDLKEGTYCYALSEADGAWYRSVITASSGSQATVFYIDYGNTEQLPITNLFACSELFFDSPNQAFKCVLSDFISTSSPDAVNNVLQTLILDQEFFGIIQSECSISSVVPHIPSYNAAVFQSETSTSTVSEDLVKQGLGNFRICNNNVEIGRKYGAFLCFDDSPGKFWIQFADQSDSLQQLMDDLNSEETVLSLKSIPSSSLIQGVACCCIFSEDGLYYRAEILKYHPPDETVSICFVDYGNCYKAALADVKQLPPQFASSPLFAIQCCLEGIKPIKPERPDPKLGNIAWHKEACQTFKQFVESIELEAHVVKEIFPEIFSIYLEDVDKGEDIGKLLCQSGFAEMPSQKAMGVLSHAKFASESDDYQYLDLINKAYKNLFISYAESPEVVWCQPAQEVDAFLTLTENLAKEAPQLPVLQSLKVSQPCCVLFPLDESWCRGCVQSTDDSLKSAEVLFVDFGNIEVFSYDNIKALPVKFLTLPAQAVSFSVADISPRVGQEWSKEANEAFQGMVVERCMNCKIVGVDQYGFPAAKLYNPLNNNSQIALELVQQGYARKPLTSTKSTSQSSNHLPPVSSGHISSPQRLQIESPLHSQGTLSSHESPKSNKSPSQNKYRHHSASLNEYSTIKLQAGESVEAAVCHAESMTEFYIMNSSVPELENLMQKVDAYCSSPSSKPCTSPTPNQPVLAQYSEDNSWCRASVISPPSKGSCDVLFVDYGNSERVSVSKMVQIKPEFLDLPSQAVLCALNGVSTGGDSTAEDIPDERSIDAFANMTIEQVFQVRCESNAMKKDVHVNIVDLIPSNGESVFLQLVNKGYVKRSSSHMPALPSRPPSRVAVSLPHLSVNTPVDVGISYIESPSLFYIQLADSYIELQKLSDDLNDYYSSLSASADKFNDMCIGAFCVAKFSEDNLWYRGRITAIDGSQITVHYIDFGNSETLTISSLKLLKPDFAKLPCLGIPSCLSGVRNTEGHSKEIIDEFSLFITQKLRGVLKGPLASYEDVVPVQLTDTTIPNAGVDVYATLFSHKNESALHIPVMTPVMNCPMESTISYVTSPGMLYCQLSSEKTLFDNLMNKMYSFYGENKEGSPLISSTVGSYCAVSYSDDSWYRCRITGISPQGVTVFYMDYGNTDMVESSLIRTLEPEFCSLPIQSIECHLSNIESTRSGWSEACIERLQEIVLEKTVQSIFLDGDESSGYSVQLIADGEDVVDVLHREGLVCMTSSVDTPIKFSPAISESPFVIDPYPMRKGSVYHIIITFAISPLEFYAQILDEDEKLDLIMQKLADHCASGDNRPVHSNWRPGDNILAQFTEDDGWYRGVIVSTTEDESRFQVFYFDYGNTEVLHVSRFKSIKKEFCSLPAQVVKCRLEGAQYYSYTSESTQKFNDLLLGQEFKMRCISIFEDNSYAVDLLNLESNTDVMSIAVGQKIVEHKISAKTSCSESSKLHTHAFPSGVTTDSFHDVMIVYTESPSYFFCQFSLSTADTVEVLMKEMQDFYSSSSAEGATVYKIGDFVAAQFTADEFWYRAIINDIQGDTANLIYVDYGNSEVSKLSKLKKLAPQFFTLAAQAVPCSLADVTPVGNGGWSHAAIDAFSDLTLERSCVAQVRSLQDLSGKLFKFGDGQHLLISIIDAETSKCAGKEMISMGHACSSIADSEQPDVPPPDSSPYHHPSLAEGNIYKVYVSFIESPSRFWLQFTSVEDSLAIIQDNVALEYRETPTKYPSLINPSPGIPCCAKFSQDETWYRGVVKSKHPDGLNILFVDYGNSEIVSPSDVRAIKPELLRPETHAFVCSLHDCYPMDGTEVWDENAIGVFSELTMDKILCAHVVSSSNTCSVKLIDGDSGVCEQLVQCGVAVRNTTTLTGGQVTQPRLSGVKLSVGEVYSVYVAYIDSPSKFFCQLSSNSDKLESLMAEIADFYNDHSLEPLLETGAYCVAQYSSNCAWYRAQIVSILPEGILVNFIDYGNSETVNPDQILALGSQFISLPSQAITCSMVEDTDTSFSTEILDSFIEYDLDQVFSVRITSLAPEGHCVVQLFEQEGILVNDAILSGQLSGVHTDDVQSTEPSTVSSIPVIESYQPLQYNIGSCVEVYISHVVSPNSFFCQPLECAADLDDMMTDIGLYGTSQLLPREHFKSGMVCMGRYTEDNEIYRAVIEEVISGSNALVNFVDYGNKEVLSSDRISALPLRFAKLPLQAFHCSIFDSIETDVLWNVDQVEHFRSLVPGEEQFTVQIMHFLKDRNQYYVVISKDGHPINLTHILRKKDYVTGDIAPLHHIPPESFNSSIVAVKGSKTPSGDSDNGETESDGGSEGKPLIQGPFKLSLAVQEVLDVTVVFVESPSLIYLQRADCKGEMDTLSEEIEQYCVNFEGQRFPLTFCEGDFVLAKWSEDEMWYRGEVIGVDSSSNESTCKVSFVDYGNVEVISSESLVICPKNLLELPAQAISCSLAQVPHRDSWPLMYKDLINELVGEKMLQATVVLPGSQGMKPTIKLEDVESGMDISQAVQVKLQEECESSEVIAEENEEEEEEISAVTIEDPSPKEIPPDKGELPEPILLQPLMIPERSEEFFLPSSSHEVIVISCSSPHSFICQLSCEAQKLEDVTNILYDIYGDGETPSTPVLLPSSIIEGSYVAALFSEDMQWYRAKITKCCNDFTYEVLYIDYFNSQCIPLKSIRALDSSLAVHPSLAFQCYLADTEAPCGNVQYSSDASEKMLELVGEGFCSMKIVSVDSARKCGVELTSIEGKSIGEALIEANLASPLVSSVDSSSVEDEVPISAANSIPSVELEGSVNQVSSPQSISMYPHDLESMKSVHPSEEGKSAGIAALTPPQISSPTPTSHRATHISSTSNPVSPPGSPGHIYSPTTSPLPSTIPTDSPDHAGTTLVALPDSPLPPDLPTTPPDSPLPPDLPTTPLDSPLHPDLPATPPDSPLHSNLPTTPPDSPLPPDLPTTPPDSPLPPDAPTTPPDSPLPPDSPTIPPSSPLPTDAPTIPPSSPLPPDAPTTPPDSPLPTDAPTTPPSSPLPPDLPTTPPDSPLPPDAPTTPPSSPLPPDLPTTPSDIPQSHPQNIPPHTDISVSSSSSLAASLLAVTAHTDTTTSQNDPLASSLATTDSPAVNLSNISPSHVTQPPTDPADIPLVSPSSTPYGTPLPTPENSPDRRVKVSPPPTASEYLATNLTVGSRHSVKVTAVSNLEEFSCQLLENQDQVRDIMNAIGARNYEVGGERDGLTCDNLVPSMPVCVCSSDNMWYRGKVIGSGTIPNTIKVLCVDHGNTENYPSERIKLLEQCFAESLPPQVVVCGFPVLLENDMDPTLPSSLEPWELDWPIGCIAHFTKLRSRELNMEILEVCKDGVYVVKLCNADQIDIREALIARLRDPGGCVIKEDEKFEKEDSGSETLEVIEKVGSISKEISLDGSAKRSEILQMTSVQEGSGYNGASAGSLTSDGNLMSDLEKVVADDLDDTSGREESEKNEIICESTPDTHPVEQCAPPLESLGNKNDEDNSYDVEEGMSKYPEVSLSPGSSVNLLYMSGSSPNSFICQYFDDALKLEILMSELEGHVTSLESSDPPNEYHVGDPIIAMYSKDELWYRGQVLSDDLTEGSIDVLFIDYGNIEPVHVMDLRPIIPEFTVLRKQAINCRLSTISGTTPDNWSDDAFVKFEELTMNCECMVGSVVDVGEDGVVVSLRCDSCMDVAMSLQ